MSDLERGDQKVCEMTRWYKVLTADLHSAHGGDFDWSEYVDHPEKRTPPMEDVSICERGYHATTEPMRWGIVGMRVFEVVVDGEPVDVSFDKGVWPTMGLGKECPELVPGWWHDVEDFVAELTSIPWLCPQGDPDPEWEVLGPLEAVRYVMPRPLIDESWYAVWKATRLATGDKALCLMGDMTRSEACRAGAAIAYDAAWGAVWDVVWDTKWNVEISAAPYPERLARDIAMHAANDASLWVRVLACTDPPLDQRHIDHARERMDIWRRGFWLLGYEHGIPYVCRGPSKGRRHEQKSERVGASCW